MRFCEMKPLFCAVGAFTLMACSSTPGAPTGAGGDSTTTGDGGAGGAAATTGGGAPGTTTGSGGGSSSVTSGAGGATSSSSATTGVGGGASSSSSSGSSSSGSSSSSSSASSSGSSSSSSSASSSSSSATTGVGGGASSSATSGAGGGTSATTGAGGSGGSGGNGGASSGTGASSSTGGGPVDECADGTSNCSPDATCTDLPVGFQCTCKSGYQGTGLVCADIDECATGTSTCAPNAICSNTPGSFGCACPPGTVDVNGNGSSCVAPGQGCGQAILVNPASLPVTLAGTTAPAADHYGFSAGACPGVAGAAGTASSDTAYSFTPVTSGTYTFILTGNGFDSSLYVVTDCSSVDTTCAGAVDTACTGCAESLALPLTAGTTYYVIVDGGAGSTNASGPYSLQIKPPKSFANPVQIDVSALLTDDTIVNNGLGTIDTVQVAMDGSGYDLLTQSAAKQLGGATAVGLPDDASFAANASHPFVRLGWDNGNNGPNSRILKTGNSFTFPVPADAYTQFQVYGLSTEGASSMQLTLTYSDGTTDIRNITFGDWYNDPAPAGQFFLIDGLDRAGAGQTFNSSKDPAVAGVNLNPNPAKTLVSVLVNHQTSNGWFNFYGATGW